MSMPCCSRILFHSRGLLQFIVNHLCQKFLWLLDEGNFVIGINLYSVLIFKVTLKKQG